MRVRVVNGKRTDLSEELRKELNKHLCSSLGNLNKSVRCLLGHTRFATSSISDLGGTHPHTWSPATPRRVYPLNDNSLWKSSKPEPVLQKVSNYITHNGDLDFFKSNGQHADLNLVQDWLEKATGHPIPTPVDSAAIAGLVDIIRSAGCFALSIRYAYLLKIEGSKMNLDRDLPKNYDYDQLSRVFEKALYEFCKENEVSLAQIQAKMVLRASFGDVVLDYIKNGFDLPNSAFDDFTAGDGDDLEGAFASRSMAELVEQAIDAFFDNDLFTTTKLFLKDAVGSFGLMISSSMDSDYQICIAARGQPMSIAF